AYFRVYVLSGISDAPTLLLGDKAVVNQAAYWIKLPYTKVKILPVARPKRGDLVQVLRPDRPLLVFKRVIGLPGETIEIHDNQIAINGKALRQTALPPADFSWVSAAHKMGNTVYDEDGHWAAFTPGAGQPLAPFHLKGMSTFSSATIAM
ncbi:MAG: signal peptidase I, partial [Bryobacteraceae bacterium]